MKRTRWLQETKQIRLEEAYSGSREGELPARWKDLMARPAKAAKAPAKKK